MSVKNSVAVEVKNLSYTYTSEEVLKDISFRIEAGSYVGVIGPNGGGKTTLLKLLLGLLKPQKGTITLLGKSIQKLDNRANIGYVPQRISQENVVFPATVYEVVESGRIPRKQMFQFLNNEDRTIIEKVMSIARIDTFKDRLLTELSGGQRQRVYVARALASEPKVLILDEPFVGIDISAQQEFYTFLKTLNEKEKLTIIFVSHDIDIISNEVKELLCLNKRLVCQGKPKDIIEHSMIEQLYGKKVIHIHHGH